MHSQIEISIFDHQKHTTSLNAFRFMSRKRFTYNIVSIKILNGCHGSGFANDYTYCGATALSVIDYLISTIDLFNYVDKFIISNFNEYSDHASLLKIKIFTQKIKLINI
jgi:hypothetical protein